MKRPYVLINEHGWFYYIDLDFGSSADVVLTSLNNTNLTDGVLVPVLF